MAGTIHPSFARWVHRSTVFTCVASVREGDEFGPRVVVVSPTIIFVCDDGGGVRRLVKLAHVKAMSVSTKDMLVALDEGEGENARLHVVFDITDPRNLLPSSDLPMHVADLLKAAGRGDAVQITNTDLGPDAETAGDVPPPSNTVLPSPTPMPQPVAPVVSSPAVLPNLPNFPGPHSAVPMSEIRGLTEADDRGVSASASPVVPNGGRQNRFTSPPPLGKAAEPGRKPQRAPAPPPPAPPSPRADGATPGSGGYLQWIRDQKQEGARLSREIDDAIKTFAQMEAGLPGQDAGGAPAAAAPTAAKTFDYHRPCGAAGPSLPQRLGYNVPLCTVLDFPGLPRPPPRGISDAEATLDAHLSRPAPCPNETSGTTMRSGSHASSETTLPPVTDGAADVGSLLVEKMADTLERHLPPPPAGAPDAAELWASFVASLPEGVFPEDFVCARDDTMRAVFTALGFPSLQAAVLETEWGRRRGAAPPAASPLDRSGMSGVPHALSVTIGGAADGSQHAASTEHSKDDMGAWLAPAPTQAAGAAWRRFLSAVAREEGKDVDSAGGSEAGGAEGDADPSPRGMAWLEGLPFPLFREAVRELGTRDALPFAMVESEWLRRSRKTAPGAAPQTTAPPSVPSMPPPVTSETYLEHFNPVVAQARQREARGVTSPGAAIVPARPAAPLPGWATVNKLLKEFVTGAFVTLDQVEPIDVPAGLEADFNARAQAAGETPVLLWHEVVGEAAAAAPPALHMVEGPAGEGFYFPADPQPESTFRDGANHLVLVEVLLGRLKDVQAPAPALTGEQLGEDGYDTVRYLNIDQGMYVVHNQGRLLPRYLVTFTVEKWRGGAAQSAVLRKMEAQTQEIYDKMALVDRMQARVSDVRDAELQRLQAAAEELKQVIDRTAAAVGTRITHTAEHASVDLTAAKGKLVMVEEGLMNGVAYLRKAMQLHDPSSIEAAGQVLDTFLLKSEPSLRLPTVRLPSFAVNPGGAPLGDALLRFDAYDETPYHNGAAVPKDGVGGAAAPEPAEAAGALSPSRAPPQEVDLSSHDAAFDGTGVMAYLARRVGGDEGNAMDAEEVNLIASAGAHPRATHSLASLCGAARGGFFLSKDQIGGWICIDLRAHTLCPSAYALEHGVAGSDAFALRNWVFEASNDAVNWTELAKHTDDHCLGALKPSHAWPLAAPPGAFFRFFRVRLTSPCANSSAWCLCLGGVELYGVLRLGR